MLKEKFARNSMVVDVVAGAETTTEELGGTNVRATAAVETSNLFVTPFWKRFYDMECALNAQLATLQPPAAITHRYNPVEYAAELHCAYLKQFLGGPKRLLFVGMNPGPNGMVQTGVPFGNIHTVRQVMQLSGNIVPPEHLHPKRPIKGLQCTTEEPSGVRIWTLLQRLANGSLDTFARKCFVHNFCPLAFFDKDGKNITPLELKGDYKLQIRDHCLRTLDQQITLLQPEVVVAVGDYIHKTLQNSGHSGQVKMLKLPHPSYRAVNNQNWPAKAESMLVENQLLKYIRNEA